MTDEDSDDDAIARLLAGAGGTWSGWTPVGDSCHPDVCCQANWQQRVAGFSFGYVEAQFKADFTGLSPSTSYVCNFQVYRRLYGSVGAWVLLLDSPIGFTTDGSGNYSIPEQDVPNLVGYETYACCPYVYEP